jgi:hypothetical protein
MRNTKEPSKLDQWLRSRRRRYSLMVLMVHQNSLILLFLLPHPLDFDDLSCIWKDVVSGNLLSRFGTDSFTGRGE